MGLDIYIKRDDMFVLVSSGDDISSPISTVHDGRSGDTLTLPLFLRNDETVKWYSNIRITPVDLVDPNPYGDIIYNETGWGVKLNQGSIEPTRGEWEDLEWGKFIDMDNVGTELGADTATYFPFWYLITCPPNIDAQTKTDIVLRVTYTENAVI